MNRTNGTFQCLREEQLSWAMRVLSVIGLLALIASLSRALSIGWQSVMWLHIFLYLVVVGITVFQNHLSFKIRACTLIVIPLVIGVGGLLTFGLFAVGVQSLFTFCILSTMLLGRRAGIQSAVVSLFVLGIIGILFSMGRITLNFDAREYMTSFTAWFGAMTAIVISAGIIVMALGTYHQKIENLLDVLEERNRALETEIAERSKLEAERRALEERVQRAKRIEDLATLAGGVAHDLNNILAGAVTYPDFLLSTLPEDSSFREPLETIRRSGTKAATIVDDLLTLARRGLAISSVVNLNSIIGDYFESPEYQKLKSYHPKVEVEISIDSDLPNIKGAPFHLQKAIMNLISNAAEAIPEEGKITVSTRSGHIEQYVGAFDEIPGGEYVILTVSDTGIGMLPDDVEKIFEPFFTKKTLGRSGTGLGMTVVWGTVKDHDGRIDIQSTMGEGTIFTLYFPITTEEIVPPQSLLPAQEFAGKGESILIVDDVEDQREIAAAMLNNLGYSVKTAESGEEALAFLEKESVDLLLLDMCMEPGIDGLETYRRVLQIRPRQKALIMSGYSETWRIKVAQKLGAGNFVKKPFYVSVIGTTIRAELDKEESQSFLC